MGFRFWGLWLGLGFGVWGLVFREFGVGGLGLGFIGKTEKKVVH